MKLIIRLVVLAVVACTTIFCLWYYSDRLNKHDNGFKRNFIPYAVTVTNRYAITDSVKTICGAANNRLFLATADTRHFMAIDLLEGGCKDLYIPISLITAKKINYQFFSDIHYPWLYIFAYNRRLIEKYNLQTGALEQLYKPGSIFTRGVPISSDSYIFRQMDGPSRDQLFSRWNIVSGELKEVPNLTRIWHDAGLRTDGKLYYDTVSGNLIYMHSYFNRFLKLDTQLNLIKEYKTIDTFSFPLVSGGETHNGVFTNTSPGFIINRTGCVGKGKLFIYSSLKADNESNNDFYRHEVIDMYDIASGKYQYSFYIPRMEGEKVTNMIVYGNDLIAFYMHTVVVVRLNLFRF